MGSAIARCASAINTHPVTERELQGLEACYRDHRGELLRFLVARTGDPGEAEEILRDVDLHDRRHTHAGALSRGDKRRMELAMCLIQHPRLLLLDEPTAGMSRHDINTTIELLKKIKARGMTKVIIEHDMHVVFSLADRISVLSGGRIIAEGTPDEVRGNVKVQEAYLGGAHRLEPAE